VIEYPSVHYFWNLESHTFAKGSTIVFGGL
jgi:hypothetical protein